MAYLQQSRLCSSWPLQLQAVSENVKGFAGTLTQNDMQVVRMWIGGADFQHLDALQPMQPGQYLPRALLPMPHFIAASPYPFASWGCPGPKLPISAAAYEQSGHCLLSNCIICL